MGIAVAAVMILIALALLRSEWEKLQLCTVRYRISTEKRLAVPGEREGEGGRLRLLFISDLHDYAPARHRPDMILGKIDAEHPDAILVGGDMITVSKYRKHPVPDTGSALVLLKALAEKYPVYYGEGNHESRLREKNSGAYAAYVSELLASGVRYLSDTSIPLAAVRRDETGIAGAEGTAGTETGVTVCGITPEPEYYRASPGFGPGPCPEEGYLQKKLAGTDPSSFRILLIHSPAFLKEAAAQKADLVLSGHYHGGTVRLPGGRGLMTPQYRFFVKECFGRFTEGKTDMIVSGGLGTHSIKMRLNDLPELTVIDITEE